MTKSNKRRRCINVDGVFVELLRKESEKLKKTSATRLATLILIGKHPPVGPCDRTKESRGVSMTEALWLAVKRRDKNSQKSAVEVTEAILSGTMEPLTAKEIKHGNKRAAEREAKRAESDPEEKVAPKDEVPKVAPKPAKKESKINSENIDPTYDVKAEREREEEERVKQRMKLHKGQTYDQESSRGPDRLEPGEEFYGGVKLL
jgi:hypothetical protein